MNFFSFGSTLAQVLIGIYSSPAGISAAAYVWKIGQLKDITYEAVLKKKGLTWTYKLKEWQGRSQSATFKVISGTWAITQSNIKKSHT